MRANTVTLTGNVVVTRGTDVLRGQRLVVDLTTGVTKMDLAGSKVCFSGPPTASDCGVPPTRRLALRQPARVTASPIG